MIKFTLATTSFVFVTLSNLLLSAAGSLLALLATLVGLGVLHRLVVRPTMKRIWRY